MTEPPPKGGPMARQAAMLCQDPAFRLYLDRRRRYKWGMNKRALPDGTHSEQDARDWLCAACPLKPSACFARYATASTPGEQSKEGGGA